MEIEPRKRLFEDKIKPILKYVGTIGAVLTSIAYIIIVFTMIRGFQSHTNLQTLTFAIVNALVGLVIVQFLKVQGIAFARDLDENQAVEKIYYTTKTKNKKAHSVTYYWFTSVFKDIFSKGASIVITTAGLIYIVIEGSNDYSLLLIAIVNLLLFVCFGLLSLVNAYDFYNCNHVPFMLERINERNLNKGDKE